MNDDWDSVTVLRKRAPAGGATAGNPDKAVNEARRKGLEVETTKKYGAGGNAQHHAVKNSAVLDRETKELHHNTVKLDTARAIAQGRQALGITQKELATKIAEKPQVINEYENGKAIPDSKIISKIERVIKIKITGKNIGQPIAPKGAKK